MDLLNFIVYILPVLLAACFALQIHTVKKKNKELGLILNRINDAVISIDRDWKYTFLNDTALATHPLGRQETLGKVLWDVHPGLVGTIFWDTYHQAMSTDTFMEIESYYKVMDKWFLIKIYPSDTGLTILYQDVTESKIIKDQLIQSEEKYRTLFFKNPLPTWLYDLESLQFVEVNEAAIQHYGYTRDEFLSMTIKDIRPADDVELLVEDIVQVKKDIDRSRHGKWRHVKKSGDIIIAETTGYSINHYGRIVRIVVSNDITQKETAQQQLLENQTKLKEAQAIARISSWDVDLVSNQSTWSDEIYKIFELNKEGTVPSLDLFLSFISPKDRQTVQSQIEQARKDFTESKIEFRFTTCSGKKRYGYSEWRYGYDAGKKPIRLFGILQDVTERKEAEEKSRLLENQIKEQKIQEQKKITKAIIKAQDRQKNYIAQELHDNISQILFGAKFHLGIAGRKDQNVQGLIQPSLELINDAMQEIHALCHSLATPLKNIYLQQMIEGLLVKQNANCEKPVGINFIYSVSNNLSDDLKLNIYRIVQELLNNIVKHADAGNVEIAIGDKDGCINIIVKDDGKGYDVKHNRKGLGISNIIDRVETFNGKVKMQSNPKEGTSTDITIPYQLMRQN